jgi:hypothetical protein
MSVSCDFHVLSSCQVDVSASADRLSRGVLPSVVSECDRKASIMRWPLAH